MKKPMIYVVTLFYANKEVKVYRLNDFSQTFNLWIKHD